MLKFYGFDVSPWSNRVHFTLNALGLDYEYNRVNLLGGAGQSKEHLAVHPAGKVPAIDDDGFILFESGAITRYLAAKAGSSLYPADLQKRARVDQWTDFATQHIAKAMEKVLFNRVLYTVMKTGNDENSLNEGLNFLNRFLPLVDQQLGTCKHFAMDDLTLADTALLAWLDPSEVSEVDLSAYSNITQWRNKLMQQDFYTRCFPSYQGMLQSMAA
ncbi:MAG: glutathione S-transferase family protein [Methylococcales bacterium]